MSASVNVRPLKAEDVPVAGIIQRDSFISSNDLIHHMLYPPSKVASSGYTQEKRDSFAAKSFRKHFDDAEAKGKIYMGAYDSNDQLVGVAVWVKPGIPVLAKKEDKKENDNNDEKNMEMDYSVLESLMSELPKQRYAVMRDTPHWYLQYLVIAPAWQGKGVGSLLMKWGLDQADSANPTLPVVLEASAMGQPIYARKGFEIKDWCRIAPSDEEGNEIVGKRVRFPVMVRPAR